MKRLCRRLDVPLYVGVGILESIWHVTGRECPCGNIGRLTDEDIALAMDYRGDEAKLIEALVSSGWVDRDPQDRLLIHDWWDHADDHVHRRVARLQLYFPGGRVPKLYGFGAEEKKKISVFYEKGNPGPGNGNHDPEIGPPKRGPDMPKGGPKGNLRASQETYTSNQQPVTGNGQPETSNRKEPAAATQLVPISGFAYPKTLAAARRKFIATDAEKALEIVNAALVDFPDTADDEIALAITECSPSATKSASYFIRAVPNAIVTIRARARDSPDSDVRYRQRKFEQARDIWESPKTPAEERAELERMYPQLREGGRHVPEKQAG